MKYLVLLCHFIFAQNVVAQYKIVVFYENPRVPAENIPIYNIDSILIGYTDEMGEQLFAENELDSMPIFLNIFGGGLNSYTLHKGTNYIFIDSKSNVLEEVTVYSTKKKLFFNKRKYGNRKMINQGGFYLNNGSMIALNIPQKIKKDEKVKTISLFVVDTLNTSGRFYIGVFETNYKGPTKLIHDSLIRIPIENPIIGNKIRKVDVSTNNIFLNRNKSYSIVALLPHDQLPIVIGGNSSMAGDYTWIYNASLRKWQKQVKCDICINHFNAVIQLESIKIK
jgi:hypothetical protein